MLARSCVSAYGVCVASLGVVELVKGQLIELNKLK